MVCPRTGKALPTASEPCNDSWRVDEPSIKVKKEWMYLYRAVDSAGNTLEFLLSPMRDAEAAKRIFVKALQSSARSASHTCLVCENKATSSLPPAFSVLQLAPCVINVDKNAAYPKAEAFLKAAGLLPQQMELRQVKYRGNLIEQDQRAHQTANEARNGLFLRSDSQTNTSGL